MPFCSEDLPTVHSKRLPTCIWGVALSLFLGQSLAIWIPFIWSRETKQVSVSVCYCKTNDMEHRLLALLKDFKKNIFNGVTITFSVTGNM